MENVISAILTISKNKKAGSGYASDYDMSSILREDNFPNPRTLVVSNINYGSCKKVGSKSLNETFDMIAKVSDFHEHIDGNRRYGNKSKHGTITMAGIGKSYVVVL